MFKTMPLIASVLAPAYDEPVAGTGDYENADVQPRIGQGFPGWQILCDMREWSLELDAPAVDVTAVSEVG